MPLASGERTTAGSPGLQEPANRWDQRFEVRYDYPVVFTRSLFDRDNGDLLWALAHREPERRHKVYVVIDQGVAQAWPRLVDTVESYFAAHADRLELVTRPIVVVGGEAAKNDPDLVGSLLARFQACRLDRQSFVLAVGGGAMLDTVGYAAAITHRGVRVVRAPSTVLAQNDAGIGVKNGINAFRTKNFLGTFAPPWAVVNDVDLVSTLQPRDRRSGIAEAVKVACIRDSAFFGWLEANASALARFDSDVMETMIRRCAELHLEHIRTCGDPFETGSARPLDFGHWAAHRIEALSRHRLRHGEAVAIGIALDTRISVLTGRLDEASQTRVWQTLRGVGFALWDEVMADVDGEGRLAIFKGLHDFREHLGGELTVTLLESIGRGLEVHEMDEAVVGQAMVDLRQAAG